MKIKWIYVLLFVLIICGLVYMSIPDRDTMLEMTRTSGSVTRTIDILQKDFEDHPNDRDVALRLATAYMEKGEPVSRMGVLATIHHRLPDDPVVQKELAWCYLDAGKMEEAMTVLPPDRRDQPFQLAMSNYYESRGELEHAEESLLGAWKGGENNLDVWLKVAQWRNFANNLTGERDALLTAAAIKPDNVETWNRLFVNRAWILDAAGTEEAVAKLDSLGAATRNHYQTLRDFQVATRDLDGAATSAGKVALLPEATLEDKLGYATLLFRTADRAKAEQYLFQIATDPETPMETSMDALNTLRANASSESNLELAKRVAELQKDPVMMEDNALMIGTIALATNQPQEADPYVLPVLESPVASPDVLELGFQLAHRKGDTAAMTALADRLDKAGVPIDDLLFPILDGPAEADVRRQALQNPKSASAFVSLARRAAMESNAPMATALIDAGLPNLDKANFVDSFAALDALSFLSNSDYGTQESRDQRLNQSFDVVEASRGTPLEKSRWYLLLASDVYNRKNNDAESERLLSELTRRYPEEHAGWLGMIRFAAARGEADKVEDMIQRLAAIPEKPTDIQMRDLIESCLALSDQFRLPDDPGVEPDLVRAEAWLARAEGLFADNRELFKEGQLDYLNITAGIAERRERWQEALDSWLAITRIEPKNGLAWVGVARSAIGLKDPDAALRALETAETLAGADDQDLRLQIAWQFLAAATAIPEDKPERAEILKTAVTYADARLAERWDEQLAVSLFWIALDNEELDKALSLSSRMKTVTPEMHIGLAEGYLAKERKDEALREAQAAAGSKDRVVLIRVAYVISQVGGKERTLEALARVEQTPGEDDVDRLLLLADTYGAVDNTDQQFALSEKRARMDGGDAAWYDAVDRHMWRGDYNGAMVLLREMDANKPNQPETLSRMLSILADDNRPGMVIDLYEKSVRSNPALEKELTADALAAIGVSYDNVRMPDRAKVFFRASLEREAANKRASIGFADVMTREGRRATAILYLKDYVVGTPDDPWGWLWLANARRDSNQSGKPDYRKVVELTEPDVNGEIPRDVRAARAVALRELGRDKEARTLLHSSMGEVMDNPHVPCDYAEMLMDIGQYDEAERVLQEVEKAFPYHVWAYRLEATILVRRQKYDAAVAKLKEALKWSPSDGEAQRDLAFAAQMWERTWKSQKNWLAAGGR